ncbi:MAG: GNAT family N-acetyltransferase, partial [Bdellovibrionota bacterium]
MPKLEIHDRERSKEAKAILNGIIKFNARFGGNEDWRELTISFKDSKGKVIGGLNGHSDWGWLFIKLLWVSEKQRGSGLGTKLMAAAEAEAKRRGCKNLWLDTFAFQAPKFYEKLGYRKFGELADYPKGYKRFFYTKRLRRPKRGRLSPESLRKRTTSPSPQ